jgi:hypothetical protein
MEILLSGVLATVLGRLIGRYILGKEWVERSERIDSRADQLAEERKRKRRNAEALPGFDEMLEARHKGLLSLSIPGTEAEPF